MPDEILAIILEGALYQPYQPHQPRPIGEPQLRGTRVTELLCVCLRFYLVTIPIIYRRITWQADSRLDSLFAALENHPEYLHHLRDLIAKRPDLVGHIGHSLFPPWLPYRYYSLGEDTVNVVHLVHLIDKQMCNSSAPRKKLNQLHLHFSRTRTDEVVYILRRLQPKIFRWEVSDADEEPSDYFEQHLPLTRSFAVLVNEYPSLGMNEWLSSLVDLSIIHFELDSDTAQLLAALPNLRRLAVGAKLMPDRSIEQIPILLTTGATRNNLEYLLVRLPVYLFNVSKERQRFQSTIGICLSLNAEPAGLPGERYGWSCRDECDSSVKVHTLFPDETTCPRCCVLLAGQGGSLQGKAPENSRDIARFECIFVRASWAITQPDTSMYPYGLCRRQHDEIFVQTHDDDEEQRANFLRRRALQCLVWADWGRV